MNSRQHSRGQFLCRLVCVLAVSLSPVVHGEDASPTFFRGLNLNGPAVTIDGHRWEGSDSTLYRCDDKAFANQNVTLRPSTDEQRARMIRSSRWGGNRVELTEIPPGTYTVFLYVWEDNRPETFTISLNGQVVAANYNSGTEGRWEKLGPWRTTVRKEGRLVLTSQGGAANFSGIEVWTGNYDGLGETVDEEQLAFFESRIRPLLVERCYECHSAESDAPGGGSAG